MHAKLILAGLAALFATTALAQTPSADLAKPPAEARHFIIESTGGKHGDSWSWVTPDGVRMARESWNLRGQVWDEDFSGKAGSDGMPAVPNPPTMMVEPFVMPATAAARDSTTLLTTADLIL